MIFQGLPVWMIGMVGIAWIGVCQSELAAGEPIESEKATFEVEVLADGLENPWAAVRLPDGRILVTERPGRLRVIDADGLNPKPIDGIPEVWAKGQGGLLDIELHPEFEENGWIYLAYSDPKGENAQTKIIRGRLKDHAFVDQEVIFEAPESEYTSRGAHFGCRMEFDRDGYLFFTIGDRGTKPDPENNAQNLSVVSGKTHRIHDDGRIPKDNPFVSQPEAAPSIWTYGNRNAQGMKFHPVTGDLWETEHGPRGGDELNILERGKNYGWPLISYGINYNGTTITEKTEAPGMEQPVIHWTPSIAVAGIDFYMGETFPNWKGNLFVSALAHQKLVRVEIDDQNQVTHQEILLEKTGRMRDVRCFDDGFVTIVYDNPGQVVRLKPVGAK